jgi:hypothetical protein
MSLGLADYSLFHSSQCDFPESTEHPSGTVSSSFWSKGFSASRFTSLSLALSRLAVRVIFLAAAVLYALCSILSDAEYGIGMATGHLEHFALASRVFPLMRMRRSGLAYALILQQIPEGIPAIQEAIRYDPNAADLWLGLVRMQLKSKDEKGYTASLARLKELAPGVEFTVTRR